MSHLGTVYDLSFSLLIEKQETSVEAENSKSMNLNEDTLQGRLTMRHFAEEIVRRFLNLESGWGRTVKELTISPGVMLRRYFDGERRDYANPLSYLVVNTLVAFVLMELTDFQQLMVSNLSTVDARTPGQLRLQQDMLDLLLKNQNFIYFAILIPFALSMRLFMRKTGYNLAEVLVFALYSIGHTALVNVVLVPVFYFLDMPILVYSAIGLGIGFFYYSYAAIQLFGGRFLTVLKTVFAYLIGFIFYMLVVVVVTVVYLTTVGQVHLRSGGWTPVNATELDAPEKLSQLLEEGEDPNYIEQVTPLHIAAKNGRVEFIDILVEHGADVNVRDHLGIVPMYLALQNMHDDVAWKLAEAGTDPTTLTDRGSSFLYVGVRDESPKLIDWALAGGVDVNAYRKDSRLATALMAAVGKGDAGLVERLLKAGADPSIKNNEELTAADLTESEEIKALLATYEKEKVENGTEAVSN